LAYGEVGDSVSVLAGQVGDGEKLAGGHDAVGNADPHHEALQGAAHATLAPGDAGAVALRINAPPAKIRSDPFRRDGIESFAGEAANLVKALPRVLGPLQALDSLRCSFLCRHFWDCRCHIESGKIKNPPPDWSGGGVMSAGVKKFLGQQPPRAS